MTTIINTPGAGTSGGASSLGIIIGVIVALALIVLFVMYGLPALRQNQGNNYQEPTGTSAGVNVNVGTPAPATPAPSPSQY